MRRTTPAEATETAPRPAELDNSAATAEPSPTRAGGLTGWHNGTRRRRLTYEEVEAARQRYAMRRALADDPEGDGLNWETVTDTLKAVAAEHGLTVSALDRMVRGISYADAPGPIDTVRAARHHAYEADKAVLGVNAARSRATSGYRSGYPLPVVIEVTAPGKKAKRYTYPAGTTVTVMSVLEGTDTGD